MTRPLETPVFSTQNSLLSKTKFVDQPTVGKSFLAERLAAAGHLGGETARKIFIASGKKEALKNSVGGIDVNRIHFDSIEARAAARETFRKLEEEDKARTAKVRAEFQAVDDDGRIDFYDLIDGKICNEFSGDVAALDEEEVTVNPKRDRYDRIKSLLPVPFHPFFDQFDETRLKERLDAIVDKVGWKTLDLLDLDPFKLEAEADKAAWIYAQKYPENDPRYQKGEHRRGRTKKIWRARMAKDVRNALSYIASNLGAVGGQNNERRPLYVADFNINHYRADQWKSREHMAKLRIVKKNDPTTQIPMLEAHKRKKIAEAAKRRMWLDIQECRATSIGARAIWTTLTLPGEYHPNPTNSTPNLNNWNPSLGPREAMEAIQEKYRQSINLLRWHDIRPWGFHTVQAQQDSTPHRHGIFFVHDTDDEILDQDASDEKVLELARGVVREFRQRFPGDYGCDARIIGDDDEEFRPETGKNGKEETVGSIIRYAARYATRNITDGDGFCETLGDDNSHGAGWKTQEEMPASDLERHAAWATERRARLCNIVGQDSRRSPSKIWEAIWKASDRGEVPNDPRMGAAVELMIQAKSVLSELIILQAEYRNHKETEQAKAEAKTRAKKNNEIQSNVTDKYRAMLDEALQKIKSDNDEGNDKEPEIDEYAVEILAELKRLQRDATGLAYHASIMMGLWQDFDLHRNERAWMRDYFDLLPHEALPLAPIPLRSTRENVYGEEVKEIIGIAAACLVTDGNKDTDKPEELSNGETLLTAPDGSWTFVKPSDDTTRQIMLRVDEWEILDKDEAKIRADKVIADRLKKKNERLEDLREVYSSEMMAVSPENSVELGKTTHEISDGDKPLALTPFDPSLEAMPLSLEALPHTDPPPA